MKIDLNPQSEREAMIAWSKYKLGFMWGAITGANLAVLVYVFFGGGT